MKDNLLVGRRALYTRIETKSTWNEQEKRYDYEEVSRESFGGLIVALVTKGEGHHPCVVMLYDDGSLRSHGIEHITIQPETSTPYRGIG